MCRPLYVDDANAYSDTEELFEPFERIFSTGGKVG